MTQVIDPKNLLTAKVAELHPDEFTAIADYAKGAFGLHLPVAKREMVFARLIKRLRTTGVADFSSYLAMIQRPDSAAERSEFLSALTTNVTQFFREPHHFDFLRQKLLPSLLELARKRGRLRIWSAGCSAGQEAYTLAMVLLDACPEAANLDIKILATDIDTKILQRAQIGQYPLEELTAIPASLHQRATSPSAEGFSITKPVRDLVTFAELNLMDHWPMTGKFDVIFCRNVAIYFDAQTQSRLWGRMSDTLANGGHLFIGHSERVSGPAAQVLKNVGVTVYAKNSHPNP